ncbi:MAG: hypothetical protein LC637_09970 [Xanthomonadaceae bacterium]|nr:hypothetical protein [Xanthomonadaceae bacterium]
MMTHALSRWVWRHCLALLLVGCTPVLAGVKVMVEVVHHGEEDFVVVCRWYGSSFNPIHGAPLKRLKERPFLAKAGEIVDCGWTAWSLWPGSAVTARVHHPVYVGSSGDETDLAKVNDATGREVEVIVVRPRTYQTWIDEVVAEYAGRMNSYRFSIELDDRTYAVRNNFAGEYLKYYRMAVGRDPDIREYRARYEERMLVIVNHATGFYRGIEVRKRRSDLLENPEKAMDEWWSGMEGRINE